MALSLAGDKKGSELSELSEDCFSGHAFHPAQVINCVPGNRLACIVDDSTLCVYNPQLFGLYTPEWRLKNSIYVVQHRPAGVIMCEVV